MGGSRSQNPRYRYAIGLRFEIPMAFEKDGDEMFEQVYRLATKQITEKLSYNNDEIIALNNNECANINRAWC